MGLLFPEVWVQQVCLKLLSLRYGEMTLDLPSSLERSSGVLLALVLLV
jgi:hypothetical protein